MSGCFGNDPEDRAREAELNRYLESQEPYDDEEEEEEEGWDDEEDNGDDDAEAFAHEKDERNTDRRCDL